jgi:L-fuculose-phosphate aldolase
VRVAPYATYGTPDLAAGVHAALESRTAALMDRHGAVTLGESARAAFTRAEYLEYVCDVQLRALATGLPVRTLPADEIERVATALGSYGRRAPGA